MNDLAERLRGEAEANEAAIDAEVAFFPSRLLREAADRLEALSTHIDKMEGTWRRVEEYPIGSDLYNKRGGCHLTHGKAEDAAMIEQLRELAK